MNDTNVKPAIVYCRVSGRIQEDQGTSLETQEQEARAYADQNGYEVAQVYREVYSGHEIYDRPALTQVRQEVRTGKYRAVILYDPRADRLTRRQGATLMLMDEFERYGTELILIGNEIEKTPWGKFRVGMNEYLAEMEREKIRDRTMGGRRQRLLQGRVSGGGFQPYGYTLNKETGRRVVIEEQAEVVRSIYRWYLEEKLSIAQIVRRLNERGVPSPSTGKRPGNKAGQAAKWWPRSVWLVLTNPAYKGETTAWKSQQDPDKTSRRDPSKRLKSPRLVARPVQDQIHLPDDVTPAVIDDATWEAVQQRLASKPRGDRRRNEESFFLLRGMIRCKVCGEPMYAGVNGGRHVYACKSRGLNYAPCGSKEVPAEPVAIPTSRGGRFLPKSECPTKTGVEWWATKKVMSLLFEPDTLDRLLEDERSHEAGAGAIESELESARTALARAENKIARLVALFAASDDSMPLDVIQSQLTVAQQERASLQETVQQLTARVGQQRAVVQRENHLVEYLFRVRDRVEGPGAEMTDETIRAIFESLGVTVFADGRDFGPITFDLPLTSNDIDPADSRSGVYAHAARAGNLCLHV